MRVLLELFICFAKIGFTSFGGLSMIPLINSEMLSHGWMTASEVSDIVAIAEMTPGPVGLNCATYAGLNVAGAAGAVFANLGVLLPTFTVTLCAALFFERFKTAKVMRRALVGIRPVCIGLVLSAVYGFCRSNYIYNGSVSVTAIATGVCAVLLLWKAKAGIPLTICISAVLGLALNYFL